MRIQAGAAKMGYGADEVTFTATVCWCGAWCWPVRPSAAELPGQATVATQTIWPCTVSTQTCSEDWQQLARHDGVRLAAAEPPPDGGLSNGEIGAKGALNAVTCMAERQPAAEMEEVLFERGAAEEVIMSDDEQEKAKKEKRRHKHHQKYLHKVKAKKEKSQHALDSDADQANEQEDKNIPKEEGTNTKGEHRAPDSDADQANEHSKQRPPDVVFSNGEIEGKVALNAVTYMAEAQQAAEMEEEVTSDNEQVKAKEEELIDKNHQKYLNKVEAKKDKKQMVAKKDTELEVTDEELHAFLTAKYPGWDSWRNPLHQEGTRNFVQEQLRHCSQAHQV